MAFNFETKKLVSELKKRKPKKVLVQLPEGIKQNTEEVVGIIEDLGIKVVVSGESCWGGCAIGVDEAVDVKADLIVHFGHAKFVDSKFPILYIEIKDELNLTPILKKSLKALKNFKTIGFSYSIQHRHDLDKIIEFYKQNGKKVILSDKKGNVAYKGHIVGCQYSGLKSIEKKVDCFVILGNNFHSIGASIAVKKPVILIDVYNHEIADMTKVRNTILRQRAIAISRFKDAKTVGIIIGTKIGQKFGLPKLIAKKLEKAGKKVILITMNEMTPDKIMNFYHIDSFVELACPRIAVDDFAKYEKPILTFREALVGIGAKSWKYLLDEGFL